MAQTHTAMHNGINVQKLMETLESFRKQPQLGQFIFRARNHWITAGHNQSAIQGFYGCGNEDTSRPQPFIVDTDEPHVLLGSDAAPNPVEWVLHALAGCLTSTLAYHAASRGIEIEAIQSELDGDLDLQGFLGLSNKVPRGYQRIRVTIRVKTDAELNTLKALAEYSPVFNTLSKPTPVEVNIVHQ